MKVCVLHLAIRDTLRKNILTASKQILKAAKLEPAFIALPEYFSVPGCMENFNSAKEISKQTHDQTIGFLSEISKQIGKIYLLGGTVVEEEAGLFYNTTTLWRNGVLLAKYKKINPIEGEIKAGIARGNQSLVLDTDFCKLGLVVCADMFDEVLVEKIASMGAEVIYLPVAAMGTHPTVKGHPLTEKVSSDYGMFVLKVGNMCSNTKGGRSAVIAPWGIMEEVSDSAKSVTIVADIDLERLRVYRKKINRA
jgi:predicted amidohydrolase